MSTNATRMGDEIDRVDAVAKVMGRAQFPSDMPVANPAYAVLLTSDIALGSIQGFDLGAAERLPGVLLILTHENVQGEIRLFPAWAGKSAPTLDGPEVAHAGQIIGLVVAESYETAREAASLVRVRYAPQTPAAGLDSPGATERTVADVDPHHRDPHKGDAQAALRSAPVTIDAEYRTPSQHHNPIELLTTTCVWEGDRLTVHEPSQFVMARGYLAACLSIPLDHIRVISRYCGGGFGGKHSGTPRTVLVAIAARRLRRPVKLMVERRQAFSMNIYRAETRHRVALAADRDGHLRALIHHGWELTSRPSTYNLSGTETTARMYGWDTVETRTHIVHTDRNSPGFMRCPHETPYMFALESGMDELAHALAMDPVELRRRNDTQVDPLDGRPFSSRGLIACLDRGAQRFDWAKRQAPRSQRQGDWWVGLGMATACYPSNIGASAARVTLARDGSVKVETAFHELGNGAYTVIAQVAAARLGVPVTKVRVLLGDTDLPPATMAAASNGAASTCNAVTDACEVLRIRLATAATAVGGPLAGLAVAALRLEDGALTDGARRLELGAAVDLLGGIAEAAGSYVPDGLPPGAIERLARGIPGMRGGVKDRAQVMYGFGAQFVEVRVHARTGEIHVPRALGVFSAGRIISPRTARSQLTGGMIWGLSAALLEASEVDPGTARYINADLGEYLVPTNLDIGAVEAEFLDEDDTAVNPMSIKGIGEIGVCGMNAAVANAVFNATGKRLRTLPIRPRDLV